MAKTYKREPSILWYEDRCYVCGSTSFLESHEACFGSSNRKNSCEDGMWLKLCPSCHRGCGGVHRNRALDLQIKKMAECKWMEFYQKSEEDFIRRYGKSYLPIDDINEMENEI